MAVQGNDITIKIGADTYQLEQGLDNARESVVVLDSIIAAKAASYTHYAAKFGILTKAVHLLRPALVPLIPVIGAVASQFGVMRTVMIAATATILPYHAAALAASTVTRGFSGAIGTAGTYLAKSLLNLGNWHIALMGVAQVLRVVIDGVKQASATLKSLEDVGKLQATLRTSFEFADQLAGAFRRAGLSTADLNQALVTMQANIATGLGDRGNNVTTLLRGMGISATDAQGRLRSMADLLPELAQRFQGYANDGRLAALAAALFGDQAARMLPILRQGPQALHDWQVAAGQTFSVEAYDRMKRHEALTKDLEKLYKALVDVVANLLTAAYNKWQQSIVAVMTVLKPVTDELRRFLEFLAQQPPNTWFEAFRRTTDEIKRLEDQLTHFRAEEQKLRDAGTPAWLQSYQPRINQLIEQLAEAQRRLADLRSQSGTGWTAIIRPETEGAAPQTPAPTVAGIQAAESEAEAAATRLAQSAQRLARLQLDSFMDMLSGQRTIFDEMNFAWSDHASRVQQATDMINRAYADQGIAAERVARMKRQLALQEQKNMMDTATMAAQTITQLFPKSKAAGIAAAVINTAVGITNALSTGLPPWNWIQAGLIAASGAAQIATIRSTSSSGGATPAVSGSGGSAGVGEGPTSSRMLSISGLSAEGRYSGRSVMELIDEISEEVRNGATLVSTTAMRQQSA